MQSIENTLERWVNTLRETDGSELIVTPIAGILGASILYLSVFVIPELVPVPPALVTGVIAAGGVTGAAAGFHISTPETDVITVPLEGTIQRETDPINGGGIGAENVVETIEDSDSSARALVLEIDPPGGTPVPSEEIREGVKAFNGPTVAFARDTTASGAYLIAAACDHVIAREGAMVGSVGVKGSRLTFSDLADKLGVEYEQITAGEYKDAGVPLQELDDDERQYLQGLIDQHYELFLERVAEDRELDPAAVEATEARLFTGKEAVKLGLVDETGTKEDAVQYAAEQVGRDPDSHEIQTAEKTPTPGLSVAALIHQVSYAVSSGVSRSVQQVDVGSRLSIKFGDDR